MPAIVADTADKTIFGTLTLGSDDSPALGLVRCAKTADTPPVNVEAWLSKQLAFPKADLVHHAADLFPVAVRTSSTESRSRVIIRMQDSGTDVEGEYVQELPQTFYGPDLSTWHSDREGPVSVLSIAPGMVKLSRFDPARRERALANGATGEVAAVRGVVTNWTKKSQNRMMIAIRQLDLNAYIEGRVPVMVTLTLPGDWLAVAPDAATINAAFRRFKESYRYRWGNVQWIWKREFQRRGAPHWHLWLVPPAVDDDVFKEWLSLAWTSAIRPARCVIGPCGEFCVQSEWCRSLSAGTGVDRAAGMNARDPQRLAVYFLKESHGGDDKNYQNAVPWAWCVGGLLKGEQGPFPESKIPRGSVGRFWGVAGLDSVVASVEVDESHKLWRAMSAVRATGLRINGPTGFPLTRVVRSRPAIVVLAPVIEEERLRDSSGDEVWVSAREHSGVEGVRVPRRPVARVIKRKQSAGWLGLNDGPAFASQLARYARILAGFTDTTRADLPPVLAHLRPGVLSEHKSIRLRALRLKYPNRPAEHSFEKKVTAGSCRLPF